MNTMRLIMALAALSGRPIRLSSVAAPDDDPDSIRLHVESADQIKPGRSARAYRGIVYAAPARKLRMDILTPQAPGPYPLVLYLPGGGFVTARRAMAARQRHCVAQAGFAVASIDYRTVRDGATYLDGLADVAAALSFLRLHADHYGINPARTALWGESAGGYLAAMAATDPGSGVAAVTGSGVDAVIDVFGASHLATIADGFDPATVTAYTTTGAALPTYLLGPGRAFADHPAEVINADPASHITSETPPFLLLHGSDDRIVTPAQTARLHQALRRADVDSTRYVLQGAGHGALSSAPRIWTSTQVMAIIVNFLRSRLGVTPESDNKAST
ncbi:alpha/beta hydrolase [Nonomuraea sp. NEAU-A123]|uniref:alpha/beta hydrolase n=1 Tax=Nonomuraea sp. NEAU-A123 TaxID=2839649 RepID=UPI001BE46C64|nr:alpha/beta hydrolase [Nonomuraea sp. NEAU-A123]MBT2225818.1 alpha/beta hydrolase [Nonomuraea sp. NEAU-A123]